MSNEETREYFRTELEHFQKAYELHFNHFMGVFYFWVGVVTIPATAGLLTIYKDIPQTSLSYLSLLIAFLSLFVSVKMFDIRCTQLKYMSYINEIRYQLHDIDKQKIPSSYHPPFPPGTNLRKEAFKDFGFIMAIVMSCVNALFFGFGICLYFVKTGCGLLAFLLAFKIWFLIGFVFYIIFVLWRGPKTDNKTA